ASFNSDRWLFSSGAEVIYRLSPGGCTQLRGRIQASINYYVGGSLHIDASRDGTNWLSVATYDDLRRGGSNELPDRLFPAVTVFVRLACQGTNGNLQVNSFAYESQLAGPPSDVEGATHFIEVVQSSPDVAVSLRSVEEPDPNGEWRVECTLTNLADVPVSLQGALSLDADPSQEPKNQEIGTHAYGQWKLACTVGDPGAHDLTVQFRDNRGRPVFIGRVPVSSGFLRDRRPGYLLPGNKDPHVWWCESGWKVDRRRPLPEIGRAHV